MANEVVSYFHRTYFGTSRLNVDLAFSKGSNEKVGYRPWSKYSAGSSRHDQLMNSDSENNNDKDKENEEKNEHTSDKNKEIDQKKEEFLQVMMGGTKRVGKTWGNDDANGASTQHAEPNDSSDESSSDDNSDESDSDAEIEHIENDGHQDVKNSLSQHDNVENDESSNQEPLEEYASDRLFVRNLPFNATEEELKDFFSPFGNIIECHIPVDDSNRNKGYAFVKFSKSNDAIDAKEQLDGTSFQGRLIHILPSKPERDTMENTDTMEGDSTHKKKKELERQKGATETNPSWSTNFVRSDAVVDNLADRFQLDKGDVFNVKDTLSSGNAAVRLALGETKVLEENRDFFEKHGILMDELSKVGVGTKRSSTMVLVKNLPYETCHDDLSQLFSAFGNETKILLPPSRTIALVEFMNASDAKKAFRKLAYKRFKHVPLYLEWAPVGLKTSSRMNPVESATTAAITPEIKDDEDAVDSEGLRGITIYVKNLNFSTSEADVRHIFEEAIGKNVRSVRIPVKAAPINSKIKANLKHQVQQLSMGYGFVECSTEESAMKAIKNLQGKNVHGHAVELKVSTKSKGTTSAASSQSSKKNSTKLMVRNVPFQASRTDILQLFGSFGQLKTVRLPKKFDGGHRGFAFVEFTVPKEAQNAVKSLSQTHLYGRHLVIEWADGEDNMESLRSKAKRSSGSLPEVKNKKIRFD
jgi:multiple RNA-binding domain-containing protein 1